MSMYRNLRLESELAAQEEPQPAELPGEPKTA
jgi:hypothetical protein